MSVSQKYRWLGFFMWAYLDQILALGFSDQGLELGSGEGVDESGF